MKKLIASLIVVLFLSTSARGSVVASEDFDGGDVALTSSVVPALDGGPGDWFGVGSRNAWPQGFPFPGVPFSIADDSVVAYSNGGSPFAFDTEGVLGENSDFDNNYFALSDSDEFGANQTATWTFNINGVSDLSISIDFGGISNDSFDGYSLSTDVVFTAQIGANPVQIVFDLDAVDNPGFVTRPMDVGTPSGGGRLLVVSGDNPVTKLLAEDGSVAADTFLDKTPPSGAGAGQLDTFVTALNGTGSTLVLTLTADFPFEAMVFDNIVIDGVPGPALDIKPGSCPNPINLISGGFVPVALLGTTDFDVTTVDLASVALVRADGVGGSAAPNEGPPGPPSELEDVATPFLGAICDCQGSGGDGLMDLLMHFPMDDIASSLELGGLLRGALVELAVTGSLLDGTPFRVSDCVRLVPIGPPQIPVVIALEDFDGGDLNLSGTSNVFDFDAGGGSFSDVFGRVSPFDGGAGTGGPRDVWDDTVTDMSGNGVNAGDLIGVAGQNSSAFFAMNDANGSGIPPGDGSLNDATWTFDVSGSIAITSITIDIAALGDFESAASDGFLIEARTDANAFAVIFGGSTDQSAFKMYRPTDIGTAFSDDDPLEVFIDGAGQGIFYDKSDPTTGAFDIYTSVALAAVTGSTLDVKISWAGAPSGSEPMGFDGITINGIPTSLLAVSSNVAGAWIDAGPLDWTLDGGGFADFERSYPLGTVVTLAAEPVVNDRPLVGWMVDGQFIAPPPGWLPKTMLQQTVIAGEAATVEAVYGPAIRGNRRPLVDHLDLDPAAGRLHQLLD